MISHKAISVRMRIFSILVLFVNICNAQIARQDIKSFLDSALHQTGYTIEKFEQLLTPNNYDHNLLLNKAVRFKMFMDGQEYSSKLFSANCNTNSTQIGITNLKVKNKFDKGWQNANYLFNVAAKKDASFLNKYSQILNTQSKNIKSLFNYSDSNCSSMLYELQLREEGIFLDKENGRNILSFNYLLRPEKELLDGHFQEFSTLNTLPYEDFFLKINIPSSWNYKEKEEFSKPSTIGFFQPYEKFLNGAIVISVIPTNLFSKEQMKSENFSDNDIVEFVFNDDETLTNLLRYFDSNIASGGIKCSIYSTGSEKKIFYSSQYDLGEITGNNILSGQKVKFFGVLIIKNGKVFNVIGSGMNNNFDSYDYYSKLFFKVFTSIKFKEVKRNVLYLTEKHNMKYLHLYFGDNQYEFLVDTGASNIVINKTILSELMAKGIITKSNYLGESKVEIANGSIIVCQNWLIPKIRIGNTSIVNVKVGVTESENSMPLFGMDGLNKLNVFQLNLNENEIILRSE
ncbi:retropepsin-like aspartic protease [Hyunsoonleella rubra]|uniref:Retropepsin-like aspartic protease n=1 Tax=Hyunsoonleella rubra TaxID=1737062 RepID=A0ABW5TAK6_9FLAO